MSKRSVIYKGISYRNIKIMAKELNLNYRRIISRINSGYCLEDAIEKPIYSNNSFMFEGNLYRSLSDLCRVKNINLRLVEARIRRGRTLEKAINDPIKDTSIVYKGIKYASLKDLCNQYDKKYITVSKRIRILGWSLERALS